MIQTLRCEEARRTCSHCAWHAPDRGVCSFQLGDQTAPVNVMTVFGARIIHVLHVCHDNTSSNRPPPEIAAVLTAAPGRSHLSAEGDVQGGEAVTCRSHTS